LLLGVVIYLLFGSASGSVRPPCRSTCKWPGSRGGIQHTLTARGVGFAKGLWREIIIQARIVVVEVGLQKVSRAHGDMMFGMMMLCEIVGAVSRSAPPIDMVLVLSNAVANPIEAHIHGFDRFCLTDSLAMPLAVLLSVTIGVGGCGWPNLSRVMRRGAPSLPL
jgi:hypothetical protein